MCTWCGARGASAEAPENTLAAVRRAIARDADLVEVDVQRTKDGALVLLHDTTVGRTTDVRRTFPQRKPWLVGDFTYDELSRLDAGSWWSEQYSGERIPTLEQVVEILRPSRTGLLLEVKATALHPGIVDDVAGALRAIPGYVDEVVATDRLVVQSFDHHHEPARRAPGARRQPARQREGLLVTIRRPVVPVRTGWRPPGAGPGRPG